MGAKVSVTHNAGKTTREAMGHNAQALQTFSSNLSASAAVVTDSLNHGVDQVSTVIHEGVDQLGTVVSASAGAISDQIGYFTNATNGLADHVAQGSSNSASSSFMLV